MTAAESIRQIQKQLQAKLAQLKKLQAKRQKAAAGLVKIDGQIAALTGEAAPAPKPKKAAKAPAAPKPKAKKVAKAPKAPKAAKKAPTGMRGGQRPLVDYLKDILATAPQGMRVKEAAPAVQKAGYKTRAKGFYGIVAAALRGDEFVKLGRGIYALKGKAQPAKPAAPKAAKPAAKKAVAKKAQPKKAAGKKPGPKKAAKKAPKKAPAKKKSAKTPGGLHGLLIQVATGKKAMTVGEAMDAVLASGYKTKSKAFRGIVNQTLIKGEQFTQVSRGKYALKG